MIARATANRIHASGGCGSGAEGTGGARGHLPCLAWGFPDLHRFHQKVSKTVQKGGTPILTTFWEGFTLFGTPHPRWSSRIAKMTPHFHFSVSFSALRDEISGWGSKRVKPSQDRVF